MGQVSYNDIQGGKGWLYFQEYIQNSILEEFEYSAKYAHYQNHDGVKTHEDFEEEVEFKFINKIDIEIEREDKYRTSDGKGYNNERNRFELSYDRDNYWKSFKTEYAFGSHYDIQYRSYSVEKKFQFIDEMTTKIDSSLSRNTKTTNKEEKWRYGIVNEYFFNKHTTLKFSVDQTNQSRHNYTLLFSWLPVDPFDFYLQLSNINYDQSYNVMGDEDDNMNYIYERVEKGNVFSLFAKIVKRFLIHF